MENNILLYWKTIEDWLVTNNYPAPDCFAKGATEEEITAFETGQKQRLPKDFRQSLTIYNGQAEYAYVLRFYRYWSGFNLFSLNEIREAIIQRRLRAGEITDELVAAGEKLILNEIPIGESNDNDILLDLNTGKLRLTSHDGDPSRICPSFSRLLQYNADCYAAGKFYFDTQFKNIQTRDTDEMLQLIKTIPGIDDYFNMPLDSSDVQEMIEQLNKSYEPEKDFYYNLFGVPSMLNSEFFNGQSKDEFLFSDGKTFYRFLSMEQIQIQFEKNYSYFKYENLFSLPLFIDNSGKKYVLVVLNEEDYKHKLILRDENGFSECDFDFDDFLAFSYKNMLSVINE